MYPTVRTNLILVNPIYIYIYIYIYKYIKQHKKYIKGDLSSHKPLYYHGKLSKTVYVGLGLNEGVLNWKFLTMLDHSNTDRGCEY